MENKAQDKKEDKLILGGHEFNSRFILGSGKYNVNLIKAAVEQGGAEIITLALRRANTENKENILDFIPKGVTLLPNTSGARNAEEAVRIARLSREMGCGDFVKIEIMHDAKYLLPDNYETVKATEILAKEGFVVMPYMYPDLNVARDLQKLPALCRLLHRLEAITDFQPKHLYRYLLMRLICQLSWMQELASLRRHVRQWRWELLRLWLIQRLRPQEMFQQWQRRLRRL